MGEALDRPGDEFLERFRKLERDVEVLKRLPSGLKSIGPDLLADEIPGSKLLAFRTATTVSGLGTASPGAAGLLEADEEIVHLVYNGTLGRWVSPAETILNKGSRNGATLSTAYLTLVWRGNAGTELGSDTLIPWRELDTAGLKPQFRVGGLAQVNSTFNIDIAIIAAGVDEDTAASAATAEFAVANISTGGALISGYGMSAWADVPALTVADYMVITLRGRTSVVFNGNAFGGYVRMRWVSK